MVVWRDWGIRSAERSTEWRNQYITHYTIKRSYWTNKRAIRKERSVWRSATHGSIHVVPMSMTLLDETILYRRLLKGSHSSSALQAVKNYDMFKKDARNTSFESILHQFFTMLYQQLEVWYTKWIVFLLEIKCSSPRRGFRYQWEGRGRPVKHEGDGDNGEYG